METLFQDLRFAARQLRRSPAFSIAAILALALGIGANVTIFSAVNAVLLDSLPFRLIKDPRRLVSIYSSNPAIMAFVSGRLPVSFQNYQAWKEQARSFSGMEAYTDTTLNLTSNASRAPEITNAITVTPGFLRMLGVSPRIGRNFTDQESRGKSHVALISDALWRSHFNHDPNILGKLLRASNEDYQVIGVMAAQFELPATGAGLDQSKPEVLIPLNLQPTENEMGSIALSVFARLRPNVVIAQAATEMRIISQRLAKEHPDTNQGWGANVFPTIAEDVDPATRTGLWVLQIAVGFVLLIACANVANLLLTRAMAREKEMSVRIAIGATTWRIVRQNLTESLLLSVASGVLALPISVAGMKLVTYLAPEGDHGLHELALDGSVLLFALGATLISALLFGLAPSLHAARQSVAQGLGSGSRSITGASRRFRSGLTVVEVALSLMLLIGAGLTIRSLMAILAVDPGFKIDHLLTMNMALPDYRYRNPQQISAFDRQLLAKVGTLPGVKAVSLSTALPMRSISEANYSLPGEKVDANHLKVTDWTRVTGDHMRALGLRIIQGRNFSAAEAESPKPNVALVNRSFAQSNWPGQNALGKAFNFYSEEGSNTEYTIVGVVDNAHQFGPDADSHTEIYLPLNHLRVMYLLVRTTGDPLLMANAVTHQVWTIDKDQAVSRVDSMQNVLSGWLARRRFLMTILIVFSGVALLSAAFGLYSVLAYAVSLRRREIGIRVALGAAPGKVGAMVVREGVWLALMGVVIGFAGAIVQVRFMQSLIFGVKALDAVTFAAVGLLMAVIAVLASYIPSRRASRIDPLEVLRSE